MIAGGRGFRTGQRRRYCWAGSPSCTPIPLRRTRHRTCRARRRCRAEVLKIIDPHGGGHNRKSRCRWARQRRRDMRCRHPAGDATHWRPPSEVGPGATMIGASNALVIASVSCDRRIGYHFGVMLPSHGRPANCRRTGDYAVAVMPARRTCGSSGQAPLRGADSAWHRRRRGPSSNHAEERRLARPKHGIRSHRGAWFFSADHNRMAARGHRRDTAR